MKKNNKDNFTIRKAKSGDLNDILALNFKLFKKEYREYDKGLNLKWSLGKGKKYFSDKINKKDGFVEIIEYKNKIVGYLCGRIFRSDYLNNKYKYAELCNMYIKKRFRNKGLGLVLANNFKDWCKKNKVNFINVTAYAQNILGHNFYRKAGFKDLGIKFQMRIK